MNIPRTPFGTQSGAPSFQQPLENVHGPHSILREPPVVTPHCQPARLRLISSISELQQRAANVADCFVMPLVRDWYASLKPTCFSRHLSDFLSPSCTIRKIRTQIALPSISTLSWLKPKAFSVLVLETFDHGIRHLETCITWENVKETSLGAMKRIVPYDMWHNQIKDQSSVLLEKAPGAPRTSECEEAIHSFRTEEMVFRFLHQNAVPYIRKAFLVPYARSPEAIESRLLREVCSEGDLSCYLRHEPAVDKRLELGKQLVQAVNRMHTLGYCHQNLGFHTVFVTQEGEQSFQIRIGGLQFSEQFGAGQTTSHYSSFIAPECIPFIQTSTKALIHPSLDLWAIGHILCFLKHNVVPYEKFHLETIPPDMFGRRAQEMHEWLIDCLGHSEDPLDHCIVSLLSPIPEARPPLQHVQHALEEWLKSPRYTMCRKRPMEAVPKAMSALLECSDEVLFQTGMRQAMDLDGFEVRASSYITQKGQPLLSVRNPIGSSGLYLSGALPFRSESFASSCLTEYLMGDTPLLPTQKFLLTRVRPDRPSRLGPMLERQLERECEKASELIEAHVPSIVRQGLVRSYQSDGRSEVGVISEAPRYISLFHYALSEPSLAIRMQQALYMAKALLTMHERGFYHLNLNDHTVLPCADGLRLSGFKLMNKSSDIHPIGVGDQTNEFLSPELLLGQAEGRSVVPTPAMDAWSFGELLYILKRQDHSFQLSLQHLRHARFRLDLLQQWVEKTFEDASDPVDRLIARLFSASPSDRPSLQEVCGILEEFA